MTRNQLEKHLGKKVRIRLFEQSVFEGYLHKTRDEKFKHDPNLYIPRNRYFLTDSQNVCKSCLFKVSHIRYLEILN